MSVDTLFAMLVTEPFNKSFAEIRKMTLYQINRIIFHPRDEHGSILAPRAEDDGPDDRDLFYAKKRREGFTEAEIETLYDEYFRVETHKFAMRDKGTTIIRETPDGKPMGTTQAGGYTEQEIEEAGRELARRLRAKRKFMIR